MRYPDFGRRELRLCCGFALFLAFSALPLAGQTIEVTSATPAFAEQATVALDVTIGGDGFGRDARVNFLVTGTTNPGGIVVNAVTVKGRKALIANISVAPDAVVGKFDIEVTSGGRRGKGTELFSVTTKYDSSVLGSSARIDFRDAATDRIRSDGVSLPVVECDVWDYVDRLDPCYGGAAGVNALSSILSSGEYFLRTNRSTDLIPERWLVVDFSEVVSGECPGLDTRLASYAGRNPAAVSYENADPCIDLLQVRFFADGAFSPGATAVSVNLLIDGPDQNSKQQTGVLWNAKYEVVHVNPLTVAAPDAQTRIVGADGDDFRAELWTIDSRNGRRKALLGIYSMPFQAVITAVQQ